MYLQKFWTTFWYCSAVTNAATWKYHEEVSRSKTTSYCLCESANYQSFSTKVRPLKSNKHFVIRSFIKWKQHVSHTESSCMFYQFSLFSSWAWQWARFAVTNAPLGCSLNVTLSGRIAEGDKGTDTEIENGYHTYIWPTNYMCGCVCDK